MRQVDKRQVRPVLAEDRGGAASDPLRAGQAGARTPEGEERERPQFRFELLGQSFGCSADAERLAAIGTVPRLGCNTDIDVGALVEPPEQLGAAKHSASLPGSPSGGAVERFGLEEAVGLLPEAHFHRVAEQPAVADNAVPFGVRAGENGRLGGASDGGQDFLQRPHPARWGSSDPSPKRKRGSIPSPVIRAVVRRFRVENASSRSEAVQVRSMRKQPRGQAHGVDQDQRRHDSSSAGHLTVSEQGRK